MKLEGHDTNITCIKMSDDDELWSGKRSSKKKERNKRVLSK